MDQYRLIIFLVFDHVIPVVDPELVFNDKFLQGESPFFFQILELYNLTIFITDLCRFDASKSNDENFPCSYLKSKVT